MGVILTSPLIVCSIVLSISGEAKFQEDNRNLIMILGDAIICVNKCKC